MSELRHLGAVVATVSGVVLGVYVGIWLCFVGGIVQRVALAVPAGGVVAMVFFHLGEATDTGDWKWQS